MTPFLDCRHEAVGGELAPVAVNQGDAQNYNGMLLADLQAAMKGRHVLIGTHGFNVNRQTGIDNLSNWGTLLELDDSSLFIGLLWPGDSVWAHGLDYPEEPRIADDAAIKYIAPFINQYFGGAASISFASHSLGARLILKTISLLNRRVRRAIIMAGAIDDNCLNTEFQAAAANIDAISVLASHKDEVLSAAFPLGNLIGGILAQGHPWWHAALGRNGPVNPTPATFRSPFEIPDAYEFGHGNYIGAETVPLEIVRPADVPPGDPNPPYLTGDHWHASFTAAVAANRFK